MLLHPVHHHGRPAGRIEAQSGRTTRPCCARTPDQIGHHDLAKVSRVLFSEEAIRARVAELGRALAEDYRDKRPIVVGTLTGAFLFMADLVRAMQPVPEGLQTDFIRFSSYEGTGSSGTVILRMEGRIPVEGRHILLVEDIVDTGLTLQSILEYYGRRSVASVQIAALLDKQPPGGRSVNVAPQYVGFECPPEFVVGYGLDCDELYRTLPFVGVLQPGVQ